MPFDIEKIAKIKKVLVSDGEQTLMDICRKTGLSYITVRRYIDYMSKNGMISVEPVKRSGKTIKVLVRNR